MITYQHNFLPIAICIVAACDIAQNVVEVRIESKINCFDGQELSSCFKKIAEHSVDNFERTILRENLIRRVSQKF